MARLQIDDNTLAPFEKYITPTRTLEALVDQALKRVSKVAPNSRVVVLVDEELQAIEARLGHSVVVGSGKDLYGAIDQLANIKLNNVSFQFTPAQYRELMERASREGVAPEALAARIIQTMIPMFFTVAPADPPVLAGARK